MSEVVYLVSTLWVDIEDEMRNERDQVMSRVQGQEARRVRRTRCNTYCHVILVHLLLAAFYQNSIYKDDLFFNSPLAHLDILSAKYCSVSSLQEEIAGLTDLDVVLVQASHGYTSIFGHVDMSILAHLLDLLGGHYGSALVVSDR